MPDKSLIVLVAAVVATPLLALGLLLLGLGLALRGLLVQKVLVLLGHDAADLDLDAGGGELLDPDLLRLRQAVAGSCQESRSAQRGLAMDVAPGRTLDLDEDGALGLGVPEAVSTTASVL